MRQFLMGFYHPIMGFFHLMGLFNKLCQKGFLIDVPSLFKDNILFSFYSNWSIFKDCKHCDARVYNYNNSYLNKPASADPKILPGCHRSAT